MFVLRTFLTFCCQILQILIIYYLYIILPNNNTIYKQFNIIKMLLWASEFWLKQIRSNWTVYINSKILFFYIFIYHLYITLQINLQSINNLILLKCFYQFLKRQAKLGLIGLVFISKVKYCYCNIFIYYLCIIFQINKQFINNLILLKCYYQLFKRQTKLGPIG